MKQTAVFLTIFLATGGPAWAQTPPGVTPAWELQKQLDGLVVQVRKLGPLLEQVKAHEWGAAGYREQHQSATEQVEYLARSAAALAREPEKMTLALDAYMRLESLERLVDSLSEGVRRYQNPALADLIQAALTENSVSRSRLHNYLVELVSTKQEELRIANEEAQSCRSAALLPPPAHRGKPAPAAGVTRNKKP